MNRLPSGRCAHCGLYEEDCRCCCACGNHILYCTCVDELSYTNGDADEDAEAGIRGDDAGFYTDVGA